MDPTDKLQISKEFDNETQGLHEVAILQLSAKGIFSNYTPCMHTDTLNPV
jgi:hypothetical protein